MKIFVLADDFSGAAEIGGICSRYGLPASLCAKTIGSESGNLVIVNTDSRHLPEHQAMRITEMIFKHIQSNYHQFLIFKKVDSVFRGHIQAEINVLLKLSQIKRVLLLPANPHLNRFIIGGKYYVDDVPLNETQFKNDPHFPRNDADIHRIIDKSKSHLVHTHLTPDLPLPDEGFITGDVYHYQDLERYLDYSNEQDLVAGGAACFEAFLKRWVIDYKLKTKPITFARLRHNIFINGSTINDENFKNKLRHNQQQIFSIPAGLVNAGGDLNFNIDSNWLVEFLNYLKETGLVYIDINQPINNHPGVPGIYLNYLSLLASKIDQHINEFDRHYFLTGGATAQSIMEKFKIKTLQFKDEIGPGVVTLNNPASRDQLFTVKPGSYPWPEHLVNSLLLPT